MEYRVEELAAAAGVRVDTIRFYQGRGLIPKPLRRGRVAIYDDAHLSRLRRIRGLLDQGFLLAQIRRVLVSEEPGRGGATEPLLEALVEEEVGARSFTRAELAAEAGVPEALIQAAEAAGLVEPIRVDGEARFNEADAEMARASLALLGAGFPLSELLELATTHAANVRDVTETAIDLFDDYVRKTEAAEERDGDQIADAFHRLLPQVTRLVALHFQRTLVNRALDRLRGKTDVRGLERALAATQAGRLEVEWR